MTRATTIQALELAAREEGVTAEQLAELADMSLRGAQKALKELLGDHGALGVVERERKPHPVLAGRSPGAEQWIYYLRRT